MAKDRVDGDLLFVLLAVLSREPSTAYGLWRRLESDLSYLSSARRHQIYTGLAKLELGGMVSVDAGDTNPRRARRVFSLTEAGSHVLDEWLRQRTPSIPHEDELWVKLYCLERVPSELIVRHFEERLDKHEARARELARKLAKADWNDIGYRLTLDAALSYEEAQASWCRKIFFYLDRISAGPERKAA